MYFCQLIHKNYTYWIENLDWYWTTRLFAYRLPQCRNNWALFFVMVIYFEKMMEAIEIWRIKECLRNHLVQSQHWSDAKWKSTMAKGRGNKRRFQNCTDPAGQEILDLRALQGHSRRNLTDPELQDNVLIPDNFFDYIYHIGCAVNLDPSQIQDWYRADQIWAKDRRYFSRLWILWTKNTEIWI